MTKFRSKVKNLYGEGLSLEEGLTGRTRQWSGVNYNFMIFHPFKPFNCPFKSGRFEGLGGWGIVLTLWVFEVLSFSFLRCMIILWYFINSNPFYTLTVNIFFLFWGERGPGTKAVYMIILGNFIHLKPSNCPLNLAVLIVYRLLNLCFWGFFFPERCTW